jgi:hypothetical protein
MTGDLVIPPSKNKLVLCNCLHRQLEAISCLHGSGSC